MQLHGTDIEFSNIRDLLITRASLGDKALLICDGRTLSYAAADEASNRIASSLRELGIAQGDVVATFMYNSIDHAAVWLACIKLGAVFASLNVSLAPDELAYSLDDTSASLIVIDAGLIDVYLKSRNSRNGAGPIEILWRNPLSEEQDEPGEEGEQNVSDRIAAMRPYEELLAGENVVPEVVISPTDPMAIIYTGGSTSMPKGVLVPHMYYLGAALRYKEITQSRADDVHFANSHFFHVGGQQFGLMGPLFCGTTGVMTRWFSVSQYWNIARETGATIIDPIGTMMSALVTLDPTPRDRDHKVRLGIGIASGQVRQAYRQEFERRFGVTLLEVYAMTEVGVLLCSERLDDRREGSCGRTHGWADVRIVDDNETPLAPGETGQILLRPNEPNCFMLEYINKPAETIAAWRNLWYHSGDEGYLDEDGYLYYVGRRAHWIRRGGENISAFEVEKVLTGHAAVVDCGVVGVPAELGEEEVKAYIQLVAEPGQSSPSPQDLVDWCRERLAYFKVPRYIEFVDDFPRTITKQEIARHELRARGIGDCWDSRRDSR